MGALVSRIFEHLPFEYCVYISLGLLFVLWLLTKKSTKKIGFWDILRRADHRSGFADKPTFKGEEACRQIVSQIFNEPFHKERPDFLKNPETGRNLECDMINHHLKLVIEYNGAQHYYFTPYFHRTEKDFEKQKERDQFKYQKLRELGYDVIIVPYTVTNYDSFIREELRKIPRFLENL